MPRNSQVVPALQNLDPALERHVSQVQGEGPCRITFLSVAIFSSTTTLPPRVLFTQRSHQPACTEMLPALFTHRLKHDA